MKYTRFEDIPNDELGAMVDLLSRRYPVPTSVAVTEQAVFAIGQASVWQELINEQRRRERKAHEQAKGDKSG